MSVLSRVSQKGQHGKIISSFLIYGSSPLNKNERILKHFFYIFFAMALYWMLFAAILYLGIFFFFFATASYWMLFAAILYLCIFFLMTEIIKAETLHISRSDRVKNGTRFIHKHISQLKNHTKTPKCSIRSPQITDQLSFRRQKKTKLRRDFRIAGVRPRIPYSDEKLELHILESVDNQRSQNYLPI